MIKMISSFILFSTISFAQMPSDLMKTVSPELQKQLLNKNSQSLNSLDQLNINRLMNKEGLTTSNAVTDTSDTSISIDSVDKDEKDFSIYQTIFRGDTIFPDSMLKEIPIFGHDIFNKQTPSTFAPIDNFSIPSNYSISTDDEIVILLWGRINEEYRLKVGRDGSINIPRIGPVPVAGLTFETMKSTILSRINQIEGVNASISVGSMRTMGIFIVGEVTIPGFYTVSALSNITNALFAAGGINRNGSLRSVQLKRNEKLIATIDLYDFLLEGKDKTSLRLQPGDVIHVPIVTKMVAVAGNVRRSAIYELTENETLADVLSYAGGLSPSAWTNKIQISRFDKNNIQFLIDIDTTIKNYNKISIFDGDIIKIFPILDKFQNVVYLDGNVIRNGTFEYKNGMRISDLIPDYTYLLPETFFEYALIIRQDISHNVNRMLTFNLKLAIDHPQSESDIPLLGKDKIFIYNKDYFEPGRYIEIFGSVNSPGKIKLLHNMSIRDAILQAGGLNEDASNDRGELYRRVIDSNDKVQTEKINFSIDRTMNNDPESNILLKKSDRIFIRSKLGWEKEARVTLSGQFAFPGIYVVFEGESLVDLINRAGGFSNNAYLSGAIFTRFSVKEKEQQFFEEYNKQLEQEIFKISSEMAYKADPAEAKILLDQQNALKTEQSRNYKFGRVVVDLNKLENYKDFPLENGDELFVPRNSNTISVLGEVFNPSTFKFGISENSVADYIESAGGFKSNADVKHIYIIKANGKIVTNKKINILKATLNAGDAIVVPQKIKFSNPQKVFVEAIDSIFKAVTTLTALIALIYTIN